MQKTIQKLSNFLVAALLSFAVSAQNVERDAIEVASLGPQVGENVPSFELPDQHGQMRTLDDVMGQNGAMLLFRRSADW